MVHKNTYHNNNAFKLTTKRETIYGWYPSSQQNETNVDEPKEIYSKLGTRPPKREAYHNAEIIYKYQESLKPSELIYKTKQSVDEALKPPWSLNYAIKNRDSMNEDNAKTTPESMPQKRVQSAPVHTTQQIILKIPLPDMKNLFEQQQQQDDSDEIKCDDSQSNESSSSTSSETNEFMSSFNADKIVSSKRVVTATNPNGKSLLPSSNEEEREKKVNKNTKKNRTLVRPKTVAANFMHNEPISTKEMLNDALKRAKTSLGRDEIHVLNHNETHIFLKPSTPISNEKKSDPKNTPDVSVAEPEWLNNYLMSKSKLKQDMKLIDGTWKEQLINRSKHLAKRPKYFIKIDIDKLKPDPPAPHIHYKAGETFFYNTCPTRKMTFTIDPTFISENLNISKVALQSRPSSTVSNTNNKNYNNSNNGPIRFRKDFAFVY